MIYLPLIFGFGGVVWAGGMTFLYILATREIDTLKQAEKKSRERADAYEKLQSGIDEENRHLEKENAKLDVALLLCRNYVQELRAAAGAKCLEVR